jgi:hypothetical protein
MIPSQNLLCHGILRPDKQQIPCQEAWSYHSIIGKLTFLANNACTDICFAIHQCARFSSNQSTLQEQAVNFIGQYLLASPNQGMTLTPTPYLQLNIPSPTPLQQDLHLQKSYLWLTILIIITGTITIFDTMFITVDNNFFTVHTTIIPHCDSTTISLFYFTYFCNRNGSPPILF